MVFPKLGIGVAFRMHHFLEIQKSEAPIEWFELITDRFLLPAKKSLLVLEYLQERFPLVLHGIGLGIGSPLPLDFNYLKQVKDLEGELKRLGYQST